METAMRRKGRTKIRYGDEVRTAGRQLAMPRAGKGSRRTIAREFPPVRMDERGRVTLPVAARAALGIEPGAVFYVEQTAYGFRLARSENPFDGLARYAIAEDEAGRTRNLREYARERGIDIGEQ